MIRNRKHIKIMHAIFCEKLRKISERVTNFLKCLTPGIRCATTNQPSTSNSIPKPPSVTRHLDTFVKRLAARYPPQHSCALQSMEVVLCEQSSMHILCHHIQTNNVQSGSPGELQDLECRNLNLQKLAILKKIC